MTNEGWGHEPRINPIIACALSFALMFGAVAFMAQIVDNLTFVAELGNGE